MVFAEGRFGVISYWDSLRESLKTGQGLRPMLGFFLPQPGIAFQGLRSKSNRRGAAEIPLWCNESLRCGLIGRRTDAAAKPQGACCSPSHGSGKLARRNDET